MIHNFTSSLTIPSYPGIDDDGDDEDDDDDNDVDDDDDDYDADADADDDANHLMVLLSKLCSPSSNEASLWIIKYDYFISHISIDNY